MEAHVKKVRGPDHDPSVRGRILELRSQGVKIKDIATQLSVKKTYVQSFLSKNGGKLTKEQRRANVAEGRKSVTPVYPEGTTEKILELKNQGQTRNQIAETLGLDVNKVLSDLQLNRNGWNELTPEQRSEAHRKFPKATIDRALEMRRAGVSAPKIEDALGVGVGTLFFWFKQNDLHLTPEQYRMLNRQYTDEQRNQIVELRKTGLTYDAIGEHLDIPWEYVKWWLMEVGYKLEPEQVQKNARAGRDETLENYQHVIVPGFAASHGGEFLGPYVNTMEKAWWRCAKGHEFFSKPNQIQQGQWCPKCAHTRPSKGQLEVTAYIQALISDEEVLTGPRNIIAPKELDVYAPSRKFALEYNGLWWHSSGLSGWKSGRERWKFEACKRLGIRFFLLFEDEWMEKKELVKAMLRWRLGCFSGTKLHARKLELRRLDRNRFWDPFFEANHLEGSVRASWGYGLFLGNEMVMCGTVRTNPKGEKELARLASDYRFSVSGGAGRLLSAIKKETGPIVSFSNNRLSDGDVYKKIGGEKVTSSHGPSYFYTDGNRTRVNRWRCQRINDPEILAKHPKVEHTERAQAYAGLFSEKIFGDDRPLYRIEDCGHQKWLL